MSVDLQRWTKLCSEIEALVAFNNGLQSRNRRADPWPVVQQLVSDVTEHTAFFSEADTESADRSEVRISRRRATFWPRPWSGLNRRWPRSSSRTGMRGP